jgi:hypothetical protein
VPGQSGDDHLARTVVEAAVDELDARAGHLADLVAAMGGSLTAFSWSADMFQTLRKPANKTGFSGPRRQVESNPNDLAWLAG